MFGRTHHAERLPYFGESERGPPARWRELQVIRKMLALVVDELPPPPRPASFEAEGAILRAALARATGKPCQLLANLESAVEALRPYLANPQQDGHFPSSFRISTER